MFVQQFSRCHKYEIDKTAWTVVLCNQAFPSLGSDFSRLLLKYRSKLSLLYKVVLYKNFILHVYCVVSNPLPASKGHIQLVSIIFENMRVVVIRFFSGRTIFFVSCNHFRIDLGGLKLFLLLYNQPDFFRRSLFF